MATDPMSPLPILAALGLADATAVEPVMGGSDTAIWRVERGAECFALRLLREGADAAREREVAVMECAAAHGVPVPRVHSVAAWQGRPALLLSWCPGQPLAQFLRRRPWRAQRMGTLFGRMQAAIHAIPAPDALVEWEHWIEWQNAVDPALAPLLRRLERPAPMLLHLDYHPLNVMTDGTAITGVLDWTNAHAGDPRADVARTTSILRLATLSSGVRGLPARSVLRLFTAGWLAGYQRVAGAPTGLAPFYAWAGDVMRHDLAGKWDANDLARMRAWTARWRRAMPHPPTAARH